MWELAEPWLPSPAFHGRAAASGRRSNGRGLPGEIDLRPASRWLPIDGTTRGGARRAPARLTFGDGSSTGRGRCARAGCPDHGGDEPTRLAEPPAHRAGRGHTGLPRGVRTPKLLDHRIRRLPSREAPLRLHPKLRPTVRARPMTVRPRPHTPKMGEQRLVMAFRHAPRRLPDGVETDHEVAPSTPTLKLLAAMPRAQPHRHPMRQVMQRAAPLPRPPADRTHRLGTLDASLVEALHRLIVPSRPVTALHRPVTKAARLRIEQQEDRGFTLIVRGANTQLGFFGHSRGSFSDSRAKAVRPLSVNRPWEIACNESHPFVLEPRPTRRVSRSQQASAPGANVRGDPSRRRSLAISLS
jgi:hypothetical protein